MTYKIIGDSCLDPAEEKKKDEHYATVPLTLQIGDYQVVDDETFDQLDFIKKVAESPIGAKTACPSPDAFKKAFECDADMVFAITLSNHLSGSYQSAVIGKQMYEEEHGTDKKIHVIDSLSASAAEYCIAIELEKLCKEGLEFDEIVKRIEKFRDEELTFFVLETLETLRKNGRLSGLSAFFATALNIKPVMAGDGGVIVKLDQARGINKALNRMVEIAVSKLGDKTKDKTVVITQVNNPERGLFVKNAFESAAKWKDIVITEAAGVATVYACDGGIVVGIG